MFTFRRAFGLLPIFALGLFSACSAGKKAPGNLDPEQSGGTGAGAAGGTGGSAGTPVIMMTGGSGGTINPAGGSAGSGTGVAGQMFAECASAKEMGMPVPVDIYVMLDISGSMLDPAGGTDTTMTKWDAVKAALSSFFGDPQSAGLNIAIQYFPLRIAGVPTSCATDAECLGGAPCLTNICKLNPPGTLISCSSTAPDATAECTNAIQRDDGPCAMEPGAAAMTCHLSGKACAGPADCQTVAALNGDPALGACVDYGVCQNDNTFSCADTNATTNPKGCGGTLGACVPAMPGTYFCAHETQCDPDAYATPAVDFIPLPDTAMTLNGSIAAQMPLGDTPSRSALRGAIKHARDWADAHVGHTVLVLFATDGLPTECSGGRQVSGESQLALDDTVAIATEGFTPAASTSGAPPASIETFVIGVFAAADAAAAQPNLDRIAKAGGSDHARVLSSGGDVKAEFLMELANLRAARLGCEYQIPAPKTGSTLEYSQVNVFLTQPGAAGGADTSTEFYYVAPNGCTGAADEWHYDVAPSATVKPTKIVACPATCDALKMTQNAQVSIQLGCMQKVR
jgi:hypothetical protein